MNDTELPQINPVNSQTAESAAATFLPSETAYVHSHI
jgi:hypothetical protein